MNFRKTITYHTTNGRESKIFQGFGLGTPLQDVSSRDMKTPRGGCFSDELVSCPVAAVSSESITYHRSTQVMSPAREEALILRPQWTVP